jgi:hypothetical protein
MRTQIDVDAGAYQRVDVLMAGGGGTRRGGGVGEPGDRLLMFGGCRGAYCAAAPASLLGTVGVQSGRSDNLMDHVLATYSLPRTSRTPQEWRRVTWLASTLCGQRDIRQRRTRSPGRRAIAVDGARGPFAGGWVDIAWLPAEWGCLHH